MQRVLRDRVPTVFEFHYPPWQRWFVVRVFPGSDGGVSVHLTDTTDVHALQADVEASTALALDHLQKLEMLYDTAPVGMCEIDSQLRYVRINSALARMNGYPAAEHIGRTVGEMIPGLADSIEEEYRRILATGIPVFEKEVEGFTAADPLVKHHWLASWYPLRNAEGVVDGISVVAQDVTALKQAEASLRQNEDAASPGGGGGQPHGVRVGHRHRRRDAAGRGAAGRAAGSAVHLRRPGGDGAPG